MSEPLRILYCHCTYANVVPKDVKAGVLRSLSESEVAFDAVADLCEMSACKDPALARMTSSAGLKVVACYPRAVKWLFHQAGSPLPEEGVEILNMREQTAEEIVSNLLGTIEASDGEETDS